MISPLPAASGGDVRHTDAAASRAAALPLSVGEVVEVSVLGRQAGKFKIMLKGVPFEASSDLLLQEGQTIRVRIGQLFPKLLLTPIGDGAAHEENRTLIEHIKKFRLEPAIVKTIIAEGKDALSPGRMKQYRQWLPETDLAAIKERVDALVFSKDGFRDYASRLGLLHENAVASGRGSSDNLKAMLMNLREDIRNALSKGSEAVDLLTGLDEFAAHAIQKIETCQMVNVMSLENDGPFFLPLSFFFGEDLRAGEFYAAAQETPRGKEIRAVLFLDTDRLGKITAEASVLNGSIRCCFRCEMEETRDFLARRVSDLKDGLETVGYQTKEIQCCHERMMNAAKMEMMENFPAYSASILNITA